MGVLSFDTVGKLGRQPRNWVLAFSLTYAGWA